jgi:hypothetical protein
MGQRNGLTFFAVFAAVVILAAVPVYANDVAVSYHFCFKGWRPSWCTVDDTVPTAPADPISRLQASIVDLTEKVGKVHDVVKTQTDEFSRALGLAEDHLLDCQNGRTMLNDSHIRLQGRATALSAELDAMKLKYENGEIEWDTLTTIVTTILWASYAWVYAVIYGGLFIVFRAQHLFYWASSISKMCFLGFDFPKIASWVVDLKIPRLGFWTFVAVGNLATFFLGICAPYLVSVIYLWAQVQHPPLAVGIRAFEEAKGGHKVRFCLDTLRDWCYGCGKRCNTCCKGCRTCCSECRANPNAATVQTETLAAPVAVMSTQAPEPSAPAPIGGIQPVAQVSRVFRPLRSYKPGFEPVTHLGDD